VSDVPTQEAFDLGDDGALGGMTRLAEVSDDGLYRYRLTRTWGTGPRMLYVMLNPSIADDTIDDPTVVRCIGFARREGCAGIEIVNLFAYRTPEPAVLGQARRDGVDVVGPLNDSVIATVADSTRTSGAPIVFAFGNRPTNIPRVEYHDRIRGVAHIVGPGQCFGYTSGRTLRGARYPRHPLMLERERQLRSWDPVSLGDLLP
jgi:hypothetical protein